MSQPAQDYGEPWKASKRKDDATTLVTDTNNEVLEFIIFDYAGERTNRIISCVNALAGIQDPAAAIQAARDALQLVSEFLETAHIVEADWGRYQPKQITQALELLTPKKP